MLLLAETLGPSAVSWMEHYLVHGPGDVQGQRFVMDDEFAAFVYKCYRLAPRTGRRKIKRAFFSRAKGRAKSELAGWIVCFEALGPCRFDHYAVAGEVSSWGYEYDEGEPVGAPLIYVEIPIVATEEGQAGNTYDVVHYNLDSETCSPEIARDFPGLDVGLGRVVLPNSRGEISPETAGDSSKDGGKSTFIVADETHLWLLRRLKSMHSTMNRNLRKRKIASGWMLETSTMYGEGEGSVAEGTHAYAMGKHPELLFDHVQASTKWDLTDPKQRIEALKEAYGPAADWMDLDGISGDWDDPQVTESEWRRYWLNQPVPMEEKPISILPKWGGRVATDERDLPNPRLAIAVSFDRAWVSIGAAVMDDGILTVEVLRHGTMKGIIADAKELSDEFGTEILLDPKGPAKSLLQKLIDADVLIDSVSVDASYVCDAAELIFDATEDGTLEHFDQEELNAAVEIAAWRSVGDRKAYGRRRSVGSISPLEAVSLAAKAASDMPPPNPKAWVL